MEKPIQKDGLFYERKPGQRTGVQWLAEGEPSGAALVALEVQIYELNAEPQSRTGYPELNAESRR
jgi:hypothetical protein